MSRVKGKLVVVPIEEDYKSAAFDGVWYPTCPYCDTPTPAEPDAQTVCCQNCEKTVQLESIV